MTHQVGGTELWVISDDAELLRLVGQELGDEDCTVRRIPAEALAQPAFWRSAETSPAAILIDVGERLDWGVAVLRGIRRAHVRAPIVVVADAFTKEFGTKIVSEGVCYSLLREGARNELHDVVVSLLKPARGRTVETRTKQTSN